MSPLDHNAIPLECYINGDFDVILFARARQLVWTCDFAWVVPSNWYRLAWAGCPTDGPVRSVAELAGEQFGLALTTRTEPLTIGQFAQELGVITARDEEAFKGRAAKFRRLVPRSLRKPHPLFCWHPMPNEMGGYEAAYRLADERTTIVITSVDQDATRARRARSVAPPQISTRSDRGFRWQVTSLRKGP